MLLSQKINGLFILVILIQSTISVDIVSDVKKSFLGVKTATHDDTTEQDSVSMAFPIYAHDPLKYKTEEEHHSLWLDRKIAENSVDFSEFTDLLTEIEKNEWLPTLLPYSPLYKFGIGYDIEGNAPKASPFMQDLLYSGEPETLEGQDGKIRTKVITSAKDFARDISVNAKGKYKSNFGPKVKAKMSMDHSYSIQSNEVILRSSHQISLGKTILNPKNLVLSKEAQVQLAISKDKFREQYGTHFVVGFTKECSMDVFFRRKTSSSETKLQAAAELEVDGGMFEMSAGYQQSVDNSRSDSKTTIEVNYFGANDENWITGMSMSALKQAVVDFSENCSGNIADYILWPYDNVLSYQGVRTMVKFALDNVQTTVEDPFNIEEHEATPQDILNDLFTEAIIETSIIQNTLDGYITYDSSQQSAKEDVEFKFQLYEMALMQHFDSYNEILTTYSEDNYEQIQILKEAKDLLDKGVLHVNNADATKTEELDIMQQWRLLESDDVECNVDRCESCSIFSAEHCETCSDDTVLNSVTGLCEYCYVEFYDGATFGSYKGTLETGTHDNSDMVNAGIPNNIVGSVKVFGHDQCCMVGYASQTFTGWEVELPVGEYDDAALLAAGGIKDEMSSAIIYDTGCPSTSL